MTEAETFTLELCERGLGKSEPRVIETFDFATFAELEDFERKTPLREEFFYRRAQDLMGRGY